ncbi:hypothetical protein WICMUC_000060 [Wickerhamomyces mucosus]|uniref:GST N-terminal domain-containing protein n=1 Tax=Wickerhamomyces mucosus TaxID=1378264 RepID=A0A9P8PZ93_9ASCO|nr:hypothetical protein WICMUC_000060 [Wickerhamomyces mucosus]
MSEKLIVYNISSKVDTWSGSIAKVKYLLDANQVSYETVWVPFSKIGETLKARGVQPNIEPPYYTLPAITIGELTIFNSNKIIDYFINNQNDLIAKGILKKEFKAYNELVTPDFFNYFESYLWNNESLKTLIHKIIIPNEVYLLNDEDVNAFINSPLLKNLNLDEIRKEPKDYNKIWGDAIKFLNYGLQTQFDFPGLKRDKFLTGDFVYGDELSWVDILFYTNFDHYKELASANIEESQVPENGLIESQWIKSWIQRIDKLIGVSNKRLE